MLTIDQLKEISPRMAKNPNQADLYLALLDAAMQEGRVNTSQRIAGFLGQVLHESGEFRYMMEVWGPTPQQLKYDPPNPLAAKLGNTAPGDGFKYRGAGPIQITGKANYKKFGQLLSLDLVGNPDLARTPAVGMRLAVAYWVDRGLNQIADLDTEESLITITHKVNGGENGIEFRRQFWLKARKVLGLPDLV